jgi:hypothetical protein|tara:strand:- start:356 stop:583 length:228 start_codon:yes stop_codon:yes gene_type:complete
MGKVKAMYMDLENKVYDVVDEEYINACVDYSDFVKSACIDVIDCYPTVNEYSIMQICADIWHSYYNDDPAVMAGM